MSEQTLKVRKSGSECRKEGPGPGTEDRSKVRKSESEGRKRMRVVGIRLMGNANDDAEAAVELNPFCFRKVGSRDKTIKV
jgi:hypothetical protein